MIEGLPYRRQPGAPGAAPRSVVLPPARMALVRAGRPLKRWRYVAVFCEEAMLCLGDVHIGPARQTFWAVWDRRTRLLRERTRVFRHSDLELTAGRARLRDGPVELDLELDECGGVETVCAHGRSYVWTRKQGGIAARGTLRIDGGASLALNGRAVIDDTAGYHARSTEWWWTAGVGQGPGGRLLAWNLVAGVNDPPRSSERTVWVEGVPCEAAPVRFTADLSAIRAADGCELRFTLEAERRRSENLVLVRSDYRQPFGTFTGTLPGGIELARGMGVTERHRARW